MTNNEPRRYGMAAIAFGLAGTALYLTMINVTLAHIQALSDQIPFDMRPFGYTPQDAAQLLETLGTEGRKYYLTRQIPLDAIYPALLAMTLVSAILWFGARLPDNKLVRVGVVFSVGAALFDYAENLGIAAMILTWSDLSQSLVYATSFASITKSCLTTVAVLVTGILGVIWMLRPKTDLRH